MTAWLLRVWTWLKANPIWGLVGLLLLTVGYRGARIRHLEARQSRDQRKADLAALERSKLEARDREKAAAGRLTTLEAEIDAAGEEAEQGAGEAQDGHDRLKALERGHKEPRWPTK